MGDPDMLSSNHRTGGVVSPRSLWQSQGEFELAIALVNLEDFTFNAVSKDFARLVGLLEHDISGFPALTLFQEEERDKFVTGLMQLRDGVVDTYSAHQQLDPRVVPSNDLTMWSRLRAVSIGGERLALSEMNLGAVPKSFHFSASDDDLFGALVIGRVDARGYIESVSDNALQVFGESAASLIGRQLLRPWDRQELVSLHDEKPLALLEHSLAFRLRRVNSDGGDADYCCVLSSLARTSSQCFIFVPAEKVANESQTDRSSVLEQHLWRIAHEILASRVLEDFGRFPKESHFSMLGQLSGRQMDVLQRLLRGERVQTIASSLFLSPSTIRGVLSEIFLVFGVHSQSELLVMLRDENEGV